MSKVPAADRDTIHALLAAKIKRSPEVNIPHAFTDDYYPELGIGSTNPFVDEVNAALIDMDDAGLITIGESWGFGSLHVSVTDDAITGERKATPTMLCGEQSRGTGSDRAAAALWLWLLVNGFDEGSYGSKEYYGRDGFIAHLLICGLDLTASGAVRDDTWTEWAGTFYEDDEDEVECRVTGVTGYATCRCGAVAKRQVYGGVDSISALLSAILN